MSIFRFVDTFTCYGADVAGLAVLAAILTQVLKKTLLKNADKKLITFIPFAAGILLYAARMAIEDIGLFCSADAYLTLFERGIYVGALATAGYVMYEQFLRGKSCLKSEDVIAEMIKGHVKEGEEQKVAEQIFAVGMSDDRLKLIADILYANAEENSDEGEISALAAAVASTLDILNKTP